MTGVCELAEVLLGGSDVSCMSGFGCVKGAEVDELPVNPNRGTPMPTPPEHPVRRRVVQNPRQMCLRNHAANITREAA